MPRENIRRPEKALSPRFVETVTEPGKYFDGQGLFLRVSNNGAKQWVQRITIRGKRTELGLGSPPAVPLATARKLALENRGTAMLGGDPLADKRKAREGMTFAEAVDKYLAAKLSEFRNEKHRKQWRSTLDTYAAPVLGPKLVSEITVQDVLRVLQPIWAAKTETASRLRGRIENVLSWATVSGHRTGDNPARWKGNLSETLPKPSKVAKGGNQPALALSDVSRWWADLGQRDGMAARALQFLTLTAARSGEVRGLTWDEIDLGGVARSNTQGAVWTVPALRMKNGREHRVPLTPEAVALLEALPRMDGSPFVFFAPRGGMLSDMSISAVMRRIQELKTKNGEIGYLDPRNKRPAVPHGMRSTFRQWAAERGYQRDMAEIALAHFIGSEVERAYQRSDMLDRRRAMMEDWVGFLLGAEAAGNNLIQMGERQ
ncbi:tyrosine-type recombinase/integrase [Antarctobacter sp.]|uniref:tyrosine-type recombinase/integrase n=1 Tax=Antarctobacter sp. TaxID=1872577 RepID=UPI002B2727C4|nr:integrase arm-type DNA-binding domain-containing protein [Antarctobacter sp.]